MKYLLDSNILRHFIRGHLTLMENITRFKPENVALPFIVEAEQMRGRYDAVLKAEPQNLLREQLKLSLWGPAQRSARTPSSYKFREM